MKSAVNVELLRLFRKRMNQQGTNTGLFRDCQGAQYGIPEHAHANLFALPSLIDSETPQNHHRNRFRHVTAHLTRGLLPGNGPHGKRVIADDNAIVADNKSSGSPIFFVLDSAFP